MARLKVFNTSSGQWEYTGYGTTGATGNTGPTGNTGITGPPGITGPSGTPLLTSSVANVPASGVGVTGVSVTLVGSNPNRINFWAYDNSLTEIAFCALGPTATFNQGIRLNPTSGEQIVSNGDFTGPISVISSSTGTIISFTEE